MPRRRSRSSSRSSSRERDRRKRSKHEKRRRRERSSSRPRRRSPSPPARERRSKPRRRSRSASSSRARSHRSSRPARSHRRSRSRTRTRSHSRSRRSRRRERSGAARRRSHSSDRSSSSSERSRSTFPVMKKCIVDDTDSKIEKAIKAAEAAGLTMTKLPTYEYKEVDVKEDMPTIHDRNLLNELNSDSFVAKSFTSSRSKKFAENIVIDLDSVTVKVPEVEIKEEDSLLKLDELPSEEELKEMWIKKLYMYRRKILKGEI